MQIKTFFMRTPLINILVFGLGFLLLIAHMFKKIIHMWKHLHKKKNSS